MPVEGLFMQCPCQHEGVGGCEECFREIINTRFFTSKSDNMRPLILFYQDTKHHLFALSITAGFASILNDVYTL